MSVFGSSSAAGTAGAAAAASVSNAAPPSRKRFRADLEEVVEEETVVIPAVAADCPPTVEKTDFEQLKMLVERYRGDRYLKLLPMPGAVYKVLGLPTPGTSSLMDTALNCLGKTSTEEYSTTEVEVRDLSKTLTAADFPSFYTGPSHPHMLPDGGIRVITAEPTASTPEVAASSATTCAIGFSGSAGACGDGANIVSDVVEKPAAAGAMEDD